MTRPGIPGFIAVSFALLGLAAYRAPLRPLDRNPSGASSRAEALLASIPEGGDRSKLDEALRAAESRARSVEARLGPDHPDLASALLQQAGVLWLAEDYEAAHPLVTRALAIRTRAFGRGHVETAQTLYFLAEQFRVSGDYSSSRRFHEEALAIWMKHPESQSENIASSLNYLGILRWNMGDYAGARDLISRSVSIHEKMPRANQDQIAAGLNSLGSLAVAMGDRAPARVLFERARILWERTSGPNHPQVARSLTNLARLAASEGDRAEARALLRRALEIRGAAFGPDHPLVARSLVDLAALSEEDGDDASAGRLYRRAIEIDERHPIERSSDLARALIALAHLEWRRGEPERALEGALRGEAAARSHFLRTSRGLKEQDALRYESIRTRGIELALSILADGGDRAPGAAGAIFDEVIRSRAMVLDEMAARRRPRGSGGPEASVRPGLRDVTAALPEGAGLVAYLRHARAGRRRGEKEEGFYSALVLPARGMPGEIVPLAAASRIDALAAEWRAEAGRDPRGEPERDGEGSYREAGRRLREAIWDPVADRLASDRQVFLVPDGALSLVSFAALPVEGDRYLVESGPRLHYLSAERDLPSATTRGARGDGILVVGGPDFDAALEPSGNGSAPSEPVPACPAFASLRFPPLGGSLREAGEMASLLRDRAEVIDITGRRATESAFRELAPGRRILHLATHGFFLQDRCPSSLRGPWTQDAEVVQGDAPLRLSGLAMAGANRRDRFAGDAFQGEDGILTAEEIATLDLSGVEWAVLSACETGLGQVTAGEGVLGLRRAFAIAGARTLIMSLWPVDDGAARTWMRHLYERRLSGRSTVEAVEAASLAILDKQRRRGATTHPFFWGSFVAAGDWR